MCRRAAWAFLIILAVAGGEGTEGTADLDQCAETALTHRIEQLQGELKARDQRIKQLETKAEQGIHSRAIKEKPALREASDASFAATSWTQCTSEVRGISI